MKKNLLDLSLGEFVRVLCGMPERYTINLAVYSTNENEKEEDIELGEIDIYDYLEERTKGFQKERCKIILNEMEMYHCMYIDEDRLGYVNYMIGEGWNEYKIVKKPNKFHNDEIIETIDYKDAYEKLYGVTYDFMYFKAIYLLKSKIGHLKPQPEHQSKPANKSILPDKLIDEAINAGLLERTENGLKWAQTASLYGYFIDKVSDKLNLKSSNGRISWKSFMFIENHDRLLDTAKQAVNGYKNKYNNPPEGDDIVDRLLK